MMRPKENILLEPHLLNAIGEQSFTLRQQVATGDTPRAHSILLLVRATHTLGAMGVRKGEGGGSEPLEF